MENNIDSTEFTELLECQIIDFYAEKNVVIEPKIKLIIKKYGDLYSYKLEFVTAQDIYPIVIQKFYKQILPVEKNNDFSDYILKELRNRDLEFNERITFQKTDDFFDIIDYEYYN